MIETEKITLEKISVMYELREQNLTKQKTNCDERFFTTCDRHFDKQKQKNPFVKDVLEEIKKAPTQQPHVVELGL